MDLFSPPYQVAGIHLIVVAIGLRPNQTNDELNGIASRPLEQNLFLLESDSLLPDFTERLALAYCNGKDTLLKQECHQIDENSVTGCIRICHYNNARCSQWHKCYQACIFQW